MIYYYGDMWDAFDQADLFLITTNACIKKNGALVMGAGIAREAQERFPGIDLAFGRVVSRTYRSLGEYNLLVSSRWPAAKLGAFQVKWHWKEPASLPLIERSVRALNRWLRVHPAAKVHLNFPGIGNGRLHYLDVLPIVNRLPDNVHIWTNR